MSPEVPLELTFFGGEFELFGLYAVGGSSKPYAIFSSALKIIDGYSRDGLSVASNKSQISEEILMIYLRGKYSDYKKPASLKQDLLTVLDDGISPAFDISSDVPQLLCPESCDSGAVVKNERF